MVVLSRFFVFMHHSGGARSTPSGRSNHQHFSSSHCRARPSVAMPKDEAPASPLPPSSSLQLPFHPSLPPSLPLFVVTYVVLRLDKGAWREKAVARTTPAPNMRRQKEAEKRAIFQ